MKGDRQFTAVDFNQIPFVESVMEILNGHPTSSPDSGPIPDGRFYYHAPAQTAYVKTPAGFKSMTGVQKKTFKIGDGEHSIFVVTHDFASRDLMVSVRLSNSPYSMVAIDVEFTDENTVTLTCDEQIPLTQDFLSVTIMG